MSLLDYVSQMPDPNSIMANPIVQGPPQPFFDRLTRGLMPDPAGAEGLLSPDDLKAARMQGLLGLGSSLLESSGPTTQRVGLGQALGRGLQAGQGAYQGAVQGQIGNIAARQGVQMNQMKMGALQGQQAQAQKLQAARQGIIQKYGQPDLKDPQGTAHWIDSVLPELLAAGDEEMVARLSEIRKSLGQSQQGAHKIEEVVGPDGKPGFGYITPSGVQMIPGATPLTKAGSQPAPRLMTLVNPTSGKPEIAEYDPNTRGFRFTGQVPGTSRDAAGTEGERKGAVLLTMVNDSAPYLDLADAPNRIEQLMRAGGLREALTATRQVNNQAGMVIADAYIRLTSGANAPEPEVQRTMQMIVPQPGDSPQLIARKRQTRQAFVRALKLAAGRAGTQVNAGAGEVPDPSMPTGTTNPLLR